MPGAAANLTALRHEGFDDAILERMERDHNKPAARFENPFGGDQSLLQFIQFLVDENSQRLKGPGRRMNLS